MIEDQDEAPLSDQKRMLFKLESIENSLQRIVDQIDKIAGLDLRPIIDRPVSISRGRLDAGLGRARRKPICNFESIENVLILSRSRLCRTY